MNESSNTTSDRTPPTLMHVVGLLFIAGWVSVARALGEGRRTPAEMLRELRDWFAGDEAISASDAACVEALEALEALARPGAAAPAAATSGWVCRLPVSITPEQAKAIAADALAVSAEVKAAIARGEARAEAAALRGQVADLSARLHVAPSVTIRGVCSSCGCANQGDAPSWCVCRAPNRGDAPSMRASEKSEEANVGKLDSVLSEASKQVAAWPDYMHSDDVKRRRAAFDARVAAMGAQNVSDGALIKCESDASVSSTFNGVTITAPATMTLGDTWNALTSRPEMRVCLDGERRRAADEARVAALDSASAPAPIARDASTGAPVNVEVSHAVVQISTDEIQRAIDEARDAGRSEAKAEIERARVHAQAIVDDARKVLGAFEHETLFGAARRVVEERDAWQMSTEEGREIGACLRAELERARVYVGARDSEALIAAIKRVGEETAAIAATHTAQERDIAYQRGQEEMLSRVRRLVTQQIDASEAGGEYAAARLRDLGAELSRVAVAKTPTVSASEVTGEAIPGAEATETAGAGEIVARDGLPANDLAARWKASAGASREQAQHHDEPQWRGYHDGRADAYATCADELRTWRSDEAAEIARLRAQVETQKGDVQVRRAECDRLNDELAQRDAEIENLREETAAWREATGCYTHVGARERIGSLRSVIDGDRMQLEQRLNEIDTLKSKVAKARRELDRDRD